MLISPSIYLLTSSPWRLSNHLRSTHQGISGVILKIQHGGIPMWKFISLMMICCTANAAMYSCVDENGSKILRSYPCEKNEKQQAVVKVEEPPYSIINGTGVRQNYRSREPEIATKSVAHSAAPKNLYDRAKAEADSSGEPSEVPSIMDRFMRAYRAEHCLPEEYIPPPSPPVIIYQY